MMHSPTCHPGVFEPRRKEEWTDYVLAPEPAQLVLPSWQEYQAMDEVTRYRFNRDRDDQHSALVLAWTPRVAYFDKQIDVRLRANKKAPPGARQCMLISGPGTVGKSTMVKMIARKYELELRRMEPELFEERPGCDFVPVVYLTLDDNITPKKFSKALARYLHVPVSGDQSDVDDRVLDMLKSTGCRLLVIDDAHFLDCTRRDGAATNDHVKFLANCSGVTIVGTGVELEDSALLDEGTGNPRRKQTAGRFSLHAFTPFSVETTEDAREWIGVVQGLEQALALYHHEPGTLARRHWRYLHDRTLGRMAPLADIIKQSACLAISRGTDTGREEITRDLMDEIILDHWSTLEYAEVKEVKARKARRSRQGRKDRSRTAPA
jgi:Bacterial TniB protein